MTTVLVTGADGFIGSHLAELLVEQGYQVQALVHYNARSTWGWLEHSRYRQQITVHSGDIRDPFFCQSLCQGIDWVFHLAALIAIPYSYQAPQSYVQTNILGTVNLCEAARQAGVQRFIHTSSSEVYGSAQTLPIDEQHPLQPQSPYSASKIGADAMAMSYFYSFDLPVTLARPFNTYGPRQSARAIIPTIISQLAQGITRLQLGALTPMRDLNFVSDTCWGLLSIARAPQAIGKTLNIGSNQSIAMGDLAQRIARLMHCSIEIQLDSQRLRPQASEVVHLRCDNRALMALTGFQPQVTLDQGLQHSIEWFTQPDNLRHYPAQRYAI